ncbi:MAG: phosphoesterase PA-phosphatase related protein [Gemmatimonadetes bacterium]|nr:phosphoesterase PA-phosphatase related protein [Gemmatimonadota bacterium]
MSLTRPSSLFAAVACVTLIAAGGCDNQVHPTEVLPTLRAGSVDADAGSWRMIVLTGPTQFTVAAPAAVSSTAYTDELAAVRSAQAGLTDAQRAAVDYWSAGGVLRWNEIVRGLVARFSLPPAPGADGKYPVPDAENPFGDPNYPFANPAYAARAYSYVSAAQYDALKSAWYWKFQFNRPSPAKVDAGIKSLATVSDLPAYPSEDAVISGVTAELLKVLFPAAVEEITRRAIEQRNAAIWSGRATASDVAAGLALGKAVSAPFIARAGADGMRTAGGSPAAWQALADSAKLRGELAWISQESPARPPMLPLFGQVRSWMLTPAQVVAERPGPPPSTGSEQMKKELAEVKSTVDNLTREQLAIAFKWNDGAGTPTPPGHWNAIATDYVSGANMSEVRAARVFALLNMAMHDAAVSCWETKFHYFNPRPSQLDPTIKTQIGLPNFPSYSSGHSTFSAAADTVLSYLFPGSGPALDVMRDEAAISRLYGGIHYRSDIEGGKLHGKRIGAYTVQFAKADGGR